MRNLLGALLLALPLLACSEATDTARPAWEAVQAGALLIDVRSAEEFAEGHLPGAINIPHTAIVPGVLALAVDRSAPIVLYCRSGNRSSMATRSLKDAGFSGAFNGGAFDDLKPAWEAPSS